ncbi:MAG: adenylate/guanylate cyclase domain-containing protein [Bacteroidota bacterium]
MRNISGYILIFFIILNGSSGFSQYEELGAPLIKNILPKEYGYESQNFSIVQDYRGILYFGNLNGVLEFDSKFWKLISVKGIPRLAYSSDSIVYVGGYNEFGFLGSDEIGNTQYFSLMKKYKPRESQIGHVSNVISLANEIIFCTDKAIYKWNKEVIVMIDSSSGPFSLFKVDDKIIMHKQSVGLLSYVYNHFDTLPNDDFFKNIEIKEILSFSDSKLLIRTKNPDAFYIYDYKTVTPFFTQADKYLKTNIITRGVVISNGFYVFGTERCGIYIFDKNGNFVCNVNKETGLNDDQVNDIFVDRSNNLWLALNNGLARIEYPSPYSYFSKKSGINGGISAVIRHDKILYVATTQGLYYLKNEPIAYDEVNSCPVSTSFSYIKGIQAECNKLISLNGQLLLTTNDGVYQISNFALCKISGGLLETIVQSKIHSEIIYFAKEHGLGIVQYKNNEYKEIGDLKKLNRHIRTIAEQEDGTLWLGTDYNGVFMVDFSRGIDLDADVFQFKESFGLPADHGWIDVYSTENGILFSTQKGVLRFDFNAMSFIYDTLIGLEFFNTDRWLYPIVEDVHKNLWFSSGVKDNFKKNTSVGYYQGENQKYKLISNEFNIFKDFTIEEIYPDTDGIIWMGGFDGLIRYNSNNERKTDFNLKTLIRKITIKKDSVVYLGADHAGLLNDTVSSVFQHDLNNIHFEFVAPSYENSDEVLYQYYLEGFDKTWSEWAPENSRDYTNLSGGKYIFHVRAKDIFENFCEEAVFPFHIELPIYRKWYAILIYLIVAAAFVIMILRWREYLFAQERVQLEKVIAEKTEEIVKQKERAEQLIANILPPDTARELQSKGRATRKKYKMVTVLFSDIQGFTKIAEHMNPEKLLDELDKFFYQFDLVVEKMNIEKIKTIGDAYMCAGGIPIKNRTNPIDVVLSAIIMRQHMKRLRDESENDWDIRIGIHTGPVIAGVVGSKKFTYDIWGDTVNIASRMESSGSIGEINISETTYELVKTFFECEPRGKIPVKYKGDINMYFVKGIKAELSVNGKSEEPNEFFHRKLQLIRYDDLEELIMHRLEKGLPSNLYYHNLKHTIDVVVETEIIGLGEGVTKDELLLLKTAALFHDTGFLVGYEDHELLSIKIAKDTLPEFQYSEEQINIICDLIYVTKPEIEPKTLLEKIMCDSDLDYLGRTDYIPVSQNLFRELYEHNNVKTIDEWRKMQIDFIQKHEYNTLTARKMRDENKQKHLLELRQML